MTDIATARLDRATHRCKVCDARWIQNVGGTWSLASPKCGQCCDNVPMGDQIEPLREYRGWAISFDYGFYTATGPDYEASYEGPEDGWVDNGQHIEARNLEDLRAEVDAWFDEQPA